MRHGRHLHGERGRVQAAVVQGLSNRARRGALATPGIVQTSTATHAARVRGERRIGEKRDLPLAV